MKYLIATVSAVLFLACLMQPAHADAHIRGVVGAFHASMAAPEWIQLARPGSNSIFDKYTVTYHPNGGRGRTNEESVEANKDYAVKDQGYAREYYVFDGWNTRPDGLGTNYLNDQVIKVVKNITLYAKWSPRI